MVVNDDFGPSTTFDVVHVNDGKYTTIKDSIVTEVPLTIVANDIEIATLLCSPICLKELTYGFLYTSGIIHSTQDILSYILDRSNWVASVKIASNPDLRLINKRVFTSGCGKGIMFANVNEIASRNAINNEISIASTAIYTITTWLKNCSIIYKNSGGIHTAAISINGQIPTIFIDDIGRHNAVDKVIGRGLLDSIDFSKCILISSGRTSSEILHKIRSCHIPITIFRGSPTHQAVLKARDMGICMIGYARGKKFNIYSHKEKVIIQ